MNKFEFVRQDILLVKGESLYDIGATFIRMQEFYESPNPDFRGQYFTLDQYMDWYVEQHPQKQFSYFEDWAGYNIPGKAIINFYDTFYHDMRSRESAVIAHLRDYIFNEDPNFYVIGIREGDDNVYVHELRHALYSLSPEFKTACDEIYSRVPYELKDIVSKQLVDMGYSESVVPDEFQAYFGGTNGDKDSIFNNFEFKDLDPYPWINEYNRVNHEDYL